MKKATALLASIVAVVVAWTVVMWGCIILGSLLYPHDIHNPISMLGYVALGPLAGVIAAAIAYRFARNWLRAKENTVGN